MKILIFCISIISVLELHGNTIKDTILLSSEILNENRTLVIYRPEHLNVKDSITLIYMLDGEYSDYRFDAIKDNDIIGIAILNSDRRQNLLPVNEADIFMRFIEEELIPEIESHYLVRKSIIYGHSLAGGFVLYAFANQPGIFDVYIASSPLPILKSYLESINHNMDLKQNKKVCLYYSCGSKDIRQIRKGTAKLQENLR